MLKRPCCIFAIGILIIQFILIGGFQMSRDLKPSNLEQTYQENETVTVRGTIFSRENQGTYFIYRLKKIQVYQQHIWVNINHERLLVSIDKPQEIPIGNAIQISGKIHFFQENRNPGNFNQKFYYQKQKIHAQIWCNQFQIQNSHINQIKESLTLIREHGKQTLLRCLGEDAGNSMAAILLGDKKDLNQEIKQLYQKGGIGHILAISGLHMSFIGIGLYKLLRKMGAGFTFSGITGISLLLLYTIMIGAGISAIRAILMYIVRMGAEITGRDYDLLTSLSLAASLIILWQPLYLFDAGFLFSFGAILAMISIVPLLEQIQCFPTVLCPGIAIQVMLLPITIYFYYELPLWSVFTNLIVIPLMPILLGIGILGLFLTGIWYSGGSLVLQLCKLILGTYEKLCRLMIHLPFGRIVTGKPEKWMLFLYYGGLLISYLIWAYWYIQTEKKKQKCKNRMSLQKAEEQQSLLMQQKCKRFFLKIFFFMSVFFLTLWGDNHKKGTLEVTMLDVGQGDGIYLRTPVGTTCLIDGGSTDISNVGIYRIIPFLESKGVGQLDYVFVSHGDEDHINGIEQMLQNQELNVKIASLVLPSKQVWDDKLKNLVQIAIQNGTKVLITEKGQQLNETAKNQKFSLTCIAPSEDYSGETGNAASMVLDLQYEAFHMLFTGDLEGKGESQLIQDDKLTSYSVLKVAHHGSKNSSGEDLLQKITPSVAVISSGVRNRYGHPHQETLDRLTKMGCTIYNTQQNGAICIQSNGKNLRIKCFAK